MKRLAIWIVVVVAAGFGLMLAAGLAAKAMLAGSGKDGVMGSLGQRLGVAVSAGAGGFDLLEWFRLQPAISLENVTLGNPPGFGGKHLLEARKLSAQVRLGPLLRKRIEVRRLAVEQPRILVESNAQGVTNVEAFLKRLSRAEAKPGSAAGEGGGGGLAIDEFLVNSGEILISAAGLTIRGIELRVRDFSSERTCRLELAAKLFEGGESRLRLEARAGPVSPDSLPLDGKLSVLIAPAEIPSGWRQRQFGDLLRAPGKKARARLEASVQGDLYRSLKGPANLALEELRVGKDEQHVLPLSGEAPLTFSATSLVSNPSFHVKIPGARLRLGQGEWKGDAEFQVRGSTLSGRSSGAVRSVEINELVSDLTAAEGKIHGRLEIPSYAVQFAGKNADEIRNSLKGNGKLSVTQGRLAFMDLLASLQQALERAQPEAPGVRGSTPFSNLASDLNLGQARLEMSGVLLEGTGLRVNGQGTIGFDQKINFELQAQVTGAVAGLVNRLTRRDQGQEAIVPLTVRGTLDAPQVRPNVGKLARGAAMGLVESLLKKRQK